MLCEHLHPLEIELQAAGIAETYRGQAWSRNCREWVYFACLLDRPAIRARFALAECVKDHVHLGTHDGAEAGFECEVCKDGIMGYHPNHAEGKMMFR